MIDRPLVIAHRGASAAAPENTVEAFALARTLGADWVELDVRTTADGALVVVHDRELPDGRLVAELRRAELPSSVPLLDAALDACHGMGVNIEIKRALPSDVVDLLRRRDRVDEVLVSSFALDVVDGVRAIDPSVPTALLTFDLPDPTATVAAAAAAGHPGLNPFVTTVDVALVALAHRAGLAVNVWTVDEPEAIASLAALGVEGIVTNVPDVARSVLGR